MDEFSLTSKEIKNIEPFNEVPFRDCYQSALIAILKHFGKEIEPLFYTHLLYFNYDSDDKNLNPELQPIICDDQKLCVECLGLQEHTILRSDNILEDTQKEIDKGRPVIIVIDRYYQRLSPMHYHQIHINHALIIFGYNREKKIFNIIDDYYLDEDCKYKKGIISFEDLENAYSGFCKNFPQFKDIASFYSYCLSDNKEKYNIDILRKKYFSSLNKYQCLYIKSLESMKLFIDLIKQSIEEENTFYKKVGLWEKTVWWIIRFHKTDKYILNHIFTNIEFSQMDSLIDCWDKIKFYLLKISLKGKYTDKVKQDVIKLLDKAYIYEEDYIKTLNKLALSNINKA